jgi:hypothetical protein
MKVTDSFGWERGLNSSSFWNESLPSSLIYFINIHQKLRVKGNAKIQNIWYIKYDIGFRKSDRRET